ncbi:MAG TPA: hypothetical protein VF721_20155, partial [Pyrinomonadaceae bacterium]
RRGLSVISLILIFFLSPAGFAQQSNKALTNADIIKMLEAKVPESVILAKIRNSSTDFDTSTEAIVELNNKGASEKVLNAVLEKGSKKSPVETNVKAETPKETATKKQTKLDFTFELNSCRSTRGDSVECFVGVMNKDKTDRDISIVIRNIKITDEQGVEYNASTANMGPDSVPWGWYIRTTLIPEVKKLLYVKFERINSGATVIKNFRIPCSSENREFNIDFNDVKFLGSTIEKVSAIYAGSENKPAGSREPVVITAESSDATLSDALLFYNSKRYEQAYNIFSKVLERGEKVVIPVKHQHYSFWTLTKLGWNYDLCVGEFEITKDYLQFRKTKVATELNRPADGDEEFKVPWSKVAKVQYFRDSIGAIKITAAIQRKGKDQNDALTFYADDAYVKETAKTSQKPYAIFCDKIICAAKFSIVKQLLDKYVGKG